MQYAQPFRELSADKVRSRVLHRADQTLARPAHSAALCALRPTPPFALGLAPDGLAPDGLAQVANLRLTYEKTRARMVAQHYETHVRRNAEIAPISGAWNGKGEVPLTFGVYAGTAIGDSATATADGAVRPTHDGLKWNAAGGQASFMRHMISESEWAVRVDMAAVRPAVPTTHRHPLLFQPRRPIVPSRDP